MMPRDMGLQTVAGGVETAEPIEALWRISLDRLQGYYSGRALAACELRLAAESGQAA